MPVLKVKQDGVWKEIITGASFGSNIELDQTLAVEGMAADAKAVGDAIVRLSDEGSKHLTVDIDDISESEPNPVNADSLGGIIADEYASKTFVRTKIAEAQLGGGEVDLSSYVTKEELTTNTSELINEYGFATEVYVDEKFNSFNFESNEVTPEDIMEWMFEENAITPVASSSGQVYLTNDNKILIL